jgi:hypothetical protein
MRGCEGAMAGMDLGVVVYVVIYESVMCLYYYVNF